MAYEAKRVRELTDVEARILSKMTATPIPFAGYLNDQMSAAKVRTIDEFGSIEFDVDSSLRADIPDGPVLNALQPDRDTIEGHGPFINFILFVKGGLVRELQIYKDDGNAIQDTVDASKIFEVYPVRRAK